MIEAGASWILAGLPMKKLKIVIYGNFSDDINKTFDKLKQKYIKKNQKMKVSVYILPFHSN